MNFEYADMQMYYDEKFYGEPVDKADFPNLCRRAMEIIEEMTMYRVSKESFSTFQNNVRERIMNAVCAQIEYLDANGGAEMDMGGELQSAGLGSFNFTKAAGSNGSTKQSIYAPRAVRYLMPTGLMYRGGGCY